MLLIDTNRTAVSSVLEIAMSWNLYVTMIIRKLWNIVDFQTYL